MKLKDRYQTKFGLKSDVSLTGYQLKGIRVGVDNDSVALLMDPRLGKTRTDIAIAGYRFLNNHIKRWIIICPDIAKQVWVDEINKTMSIPHIIDVVKGKSEERKLLLKQWKDEPGKLSIIIINFEATWRLKKILYKFNPDRITVDESHRIKNGSTKQARMIQVLGRRAKFRSILTGTFLSNPLDAFSQYKFLDPSVFGTDKRSFCNQYVKTYGYGGYKPKTFKNLNKLNKLIHSIAFQMTRAEAKGFPEELTQTIYCELSTKALKHYREMENELKTRIQKTDIKASIVLTQALRLHQITGGFLPIENGYASIGNEKLSALIGILSEYNLTDPLVIVAKYRFEIDKIMDSVKHRKSASITGDTPGDERTSIIQKFQSGKLNTCVIQIRAGGIAINLDRANTIIFYSVTHSHIDYQQAKSRIIGRSGGSVAIIQICVKDTVDEDVYFAINEKQEFCDLIMKKFS